MKTPEELIKNEGPDQVIHFSDYLLRKTSEPSGKIFNCGFPSFDSKMKGLKSGEVIVITGKKKNGKSLFAESWLNSMMRNNDEAKALIISYENDPESTLTKYMGNNNLPLFLPWTLQTANWDWLYERCIESKLKFNCRILLLDHLHFLVDMAIKQNMSLNIGAFMRKLKQEIAIGLNMGVILIAHQQSLGRDDDASSDTMRDSSFIGQESDSVIVISRKKNYTEKEIEAIREKSFSKAQDIRSRNEIRQPGFEDTDDNPYTAGFMKIRIDVNRRTGIYEWEKVFQKQGHFVEEI